MTEQEYLEAQAECGIRVGDMVKVVRRAEDHEDGWPNGWVRSDDPHIDDDDHMDSAIGKTLGVERISDLGIQLTTAPDSIYDYPYFVLEKQGAENV